jgi:hypothetical protein
MRAICTEDGTPDDARRNAGPIRVVCDRVNEAPKCDLHAQRSTCTIYSFLPKGMLPVFTVVPHINYGAYRVAIKFIRSVYREINFSPVIVNCTRSESEANTARNGS